jgi:hypothetical protein
MLLKDGDAPPERVELGAKAPVDRPPRGQVLLEVDGELAGGVGCRRIQQGDEPVTGELRAGPGEQRAALIVDQPADRVRPVGRVVIAGFVALALEPQCPATAEPPHRGVQGLPRRNELLGRRAGEITRPIPQHRHELGLLGDDEVGGEHRPQASASDRQRISGGRMRICIGHFPR